jgi:hypothetical protein
LMTRCFDSLRLRLQVNDLNHELLVFAQSPAERVFQS